MQKTFAAAFFSLITTACAFSGGQPQKDSLIMIQTGDCPIILSAPHGGRNPIHGVAKRHGNKNIRDFVIQRDNNTLELTEQLASKLEKNFGIRPYIVIARFERKYLDVNRRPEDAYESENARYYYEEYHKAIQGASQEVLHQWGCGLFLDIHGQTARPDAIFRGTRNGKTVEDLLSRFGKTALSGQQSILGYLETKGYTTLPANNSDEAENSHFKGGYIVKTVHAETGIDAIQIEIGSYWRKKERLDKTADDLAEAIAVFTKTYMDKTND